MPGQSELAGWLQINPEHVYNAVKALRKSGELGETKTAGHASERGVSTGPELTVFQAKLIYNFLMNNPKLTSNEIAEWRKKKIEIQWDLLED